jgi:hypothetical protein
MTLDLVQVISGIIGTIAVTLAVVRLAPQVNRSTKATYSQTYQFATQALGKFERRYCQIRFTSAHGYR